MEFFSNFAYILSLRMGGMGLLMGKIGPFLTELLPLFIMEKQFLAYYTFTIWYLNETSQLCLSSKVTHCDREPSLRLFQFRSYLPLIDPKNVFLTCSSITMWNFCMIFGIQVRIMFRWPQKLLSQFHQILTELYPLFRLCHYSNRETLSTRYLENRLS